MNTARKGRAAGGLANESGGIAPCSVPKLEASKPCGCCVSHRHMDSAALPLWRYDGVPPCSLRADVKGRGPRNCTNRAAADVTMVYSHSTIHGNSGSASDASKLRGEMRNGREMVGPLYGASFPAVYSVPHPILGRGRAIYKGVGLDLGHGREVKFRDRDNRMGLQGRVEMKRTR
jgi:hypothetical protein